MPAIIRNQRIRAGGCFPANNYPSPARMSDRLTLRKVSPPAQRRELSRHTGHIDPEAFVTVVDCPPLLANDPRYMRPVTVGICQLPA